MPATFRIVYEEDGYPRELTGKSAWSRAIRSGSLTPETEVTVYAQGEAPRLSRAGTIPELAEAFGIAAPAPPLAPAPAAPDQPAPATTPVPAPAADRPAAPAAPAPAAAQEPPPPAAPSSSPKNGSSAALSIAIVVVVLFLLAFAILAPRQEAPPVQPVDMNMQGGNELATIPEPPLPSEPEEPARITYRTSFDCSRAAGAVETTVCSDAGLAAQDQTLADLYRQRLRAAFGADADALRSAQAAWRARRGECTRSAVLSDCLAAVYANRIEELRDNAGPAPQEDGGQVTDSLGETPPPASYESPPPASLARPARLRSGSISGGDYPGAALRSGAEGAVVARYTIGSDGRVVSCAVDQSSGHSALDATTCALIRRRYRYTPALDAGGKPIEETRTQRIVWRLP